jgi:hypothetical protein
VFGPPDGTTPNQSVWKLTGTKVRLHASGLEQVLGLARLRGSLYALEMSTTPGFPAGQGRVSRVTLH